MYKRQALPFSKVEELTGKPLCKSAYKYASYWYPAQDRPLSNTIYNAGYDVCLLYTSTPDRTKPITARKLGDSFDKAAVLAALEQITLRPENITPLRMGKP